MKKQEPLTPIRRVVADSVANIKNLVNSTPDTSTQDANRVFRFESLEERRVLSATGLDPGVSAPDNSAMVASEFEQPELNLQQADSISHLVVLVNGEPRELTAENNLLNVNAGDTIQISEVGVDTAANTGVFAAEAYLNKLNDFSSASLIDYDDGRFSAREDNFVADGESGTISGVGEAWTVENGFDRLTVNLLHYTEDAVDVESRLFINLQVGLPDFEFNTDVIDQILEQDIRVGDEVSIPVEFLNSLGGKFHNYAEVDIYNANDPDTIVWAGALVGNASQDNIVSGEALNLRADDPFSERFTPEEAGEYIFIYTVDPEGVNLEASELNNEYRLTVTVNPVPEPPVVVEPTASGDEDTAIELNIKTDSDAVQVSGVPEGASLNRGQAVDGQEGTFEVAATDLDGLTVTPTENSDENFQLVVTPIENDAPLNEQSVTIDVVVNAVIDGGEVNFGFQSDNFLGQEDFQGFGILEGATGNLPVATTFSDLDGSESHQITIKNLPEYINFSAGERVGSDYVIDASDLQDLTVSAGEVTDLTGFNERLGLFRFRRFEIEFTIESTEANLDETLSVISSFDLIVFARP